MSSRLDRLDNLKIKFEGIEDIREEILLLRFQQDCLVSTSDHDMEFSICLWRIRSSDFQGSSDGLLHFLVGLHACVGMLFVQKVIAADNDHRISVL